jgi:hypothetical protein
MDDAGFLLQYCLKWANFTHSLKYSYVGKSIPGTERRIGRRQAIENVADLVFDP